MLQMIHEGKLLVRIVNKFFYIPYWICIDSSDQYTDCVQYPINVDLEYVVNQHVLNFATIIGLLFVSKIFTDIINTLGLTK